MLGKHRVRMNKVVLQRGVESFGRVAAECTWVNLVAPPCRETTADYQVGASTLTPMCALHNNIDLS